MNQKKIRVGIVEDDAAFREHLCALTGGTPGYECAGAWRTAETALKHLPVEKPDVLLLDLELPGKSGLELIVELNSRQLPFEIVVLTICDDLPRIFAALENGATGYLVKPVPPARILEAIADVRAGGAPMSSAIARLVVKRFQQRGRVNQTLATLTGREEEILKLLSVGHSSKEIAEELRISARTVGTHLHHIYEKLHVHSRSQAVAKFLNP